MFTIAVNTGTFQTLRNIGFWNFLVFPHPFSVLLKDFALSFRNTFWRFLETFCGMSKTIHTDLDRMPVVARNEPGGTGIFNMVHWANQVIYKDFIRWDLGTEGNLEKYGQETPPAFDIARMTNNFK